MSVRAATGSAAQLVLGKGPQPAGLAGPQDWVLANNAQDQLTVAQDTHTVLQIDGTTRTSTVSTHISTQDNTVFGSPLILSTGSPLPSNDVPCLSHVDCGAGQCASSGFCSAGVVAADILLAPGSAGSVKLNGT